MLLRQNSPLLLAKLIIPDYGISIPHHQGEVAEWSMASVLKTEVAQATVGSNPTLSAIFRAVPIGEQTLLTCGIQPI